jgi:hypothetical protein
VRPGAACFTSDVRALAAVIVTAAAMTLVGSASAFESSVSASSARITWTTTSATRAVIAYGVDGTYLYSAREPVATTNHVVTLTDLQPGTTYTYRVGSAQGTLTTALRTDIPRFGADGTHITADGSLFFPVLSYEQCAQTIERSLAVGINTFVQVPYTGCTAAAGVTPPYVLSDDYGKTNGIGWYLPDEPDGWGITPEQMPSLPAADTTGRLRVLNLSQHFFSGQAPINDRFDRDDYKRFAAGADVVGFDMYPIVKFCGRVSLLDMFRAQRELMTIYAPGKPTFQWIETSRMTGECATIAITPEVVNAETWLAVTGGACGIGYFTNSWTGDVWNRWDFDPGVESALPQIVTRLQRLAPALCSPYRDVVVPWNGSVAASAREFNGALYVIAVNASDRATTIPFRLDGLGGRTLAVLDEARTIRPTKKVYFRDRFEPYAVHVYVAAPA